jgi:hypothetical protein
VRLLKPSLPEGNRHFTPLPASLRSREIDIPAELAEARSFAERVQLDEQPFEAAAIPAPRLVRKRDDSQVVNRMLPERLPGHGPGSLRASQHTPAYP